VMDTDTVISMSEFNSFQPQSGAACTYIQLAVIQSYLFEMRIMISFFFVNTSV
jgi:hypothetical protein